MELQSVLSVYFLLLSCPLNLNGFSLNTRPNGEELGPFWQGDIVPSLVQLSGLTKPQLRWENATIPYEFDKNYPSSMRATFLQAISHIMGRTCLTFSPRTSSPDYIFVTGSISSSCFSFIGRQGGPQIISLTERCHNLGRFVHELLHSVGFHHEQSRSDRDTFVDIIWENVKPGSELQFRKYSSSESSSFGVDYDYGSIMHYSPQAFAREPGKITIKAKQPTNQEIGQRFAMSDKDTEKVNRMYKCSGYTSNISK